MKPPDFHIIRFLCLFLIMFIMISGRLTGQGCGISAEILTEARSSSDVELEVSGLINEALSGSQSLCAVRLVFSHDRVANIRVSLLSPSGQELVLLGPGRVNAAETPFIDWNILFNDCATPNDPDEGIDGVWNNEEAWTSFSSYTGTYDPFGGCLEDFDTGSANGVWTLRIGNLGDAVFELLYFELIFCDNAGIDCEECLSFPGNFIFPLPGGVVSICEGQQPEASLLDLDSPPVLFQNQTQAFLYALGDNIIALSPDAELVPGLPPGFYSICSIVYNNEDGPLISSVSTVTELEALLASGTVCASLSPNCIGLRILEIVNEIMVDTLLCERDTLFYRGLAISGDLDTTLVIENIQNETCDTVIYFSARINRIDIDIQGLSDELVCGESLFLNALGSRASVAAIDSYTWSTTDGQLGNVQGPVTEIRAAGNYTLSIRSAGCTETFDFEVASSDSFDWDIIVDNPVCAEDSFRLELISTQGEPDLGFVGPGVVNNTGGGIYSVFEEGSYSVTARLGTCTDSISLILAGRPDPIEAVLDVTAISCLDDRARVTIETMSSIARIDVTGPESLSTDLDSFELSLPGNYTLILTDATMCSAEFGFTVEDRRESPVVSVEDILIDCNEPVPAFQPVTGSVITSASWSGPDGFMASQLSITPVDEGNYTLFITDENGCDTTVTAMFSTINVPLDALVTGGDIDCIQTEVSLCIFDAENFDSLSWTQAGMLLSNEACFTTQDPGIYSIRFFSGYCFGEENLQVEDLREIPEFNLVLSDTILSCANQEILAELEFLDAPSNYEIQWLLDGVTIQNGITELMVDQPGMYSVTILDTSNGCSEAVDFSILEAGNSFTNTTVEVNNPACFPDPGSIRLSGLPFNTPFGLSLNGEIIDLRELPVIELEPGSYDLLLTDDMGCRFERSLVIDEGRAISVDLGNDIDGTERDRVTLRAESNIPLSEIVETNWISLGNISCMLCLETDYQLIDNETVVLEIIDVDGCKASDTIEIRVKEFQPYFIPNIFSPNGDGNNDDFEIYLSGVINKVFDFRIFDRWGNLVLFRPDFSGDSSNFVWDGFYNGQKAEEGVYLYVAKLLRTDGSEEIITGEITLIR